jgi:hypothetical protein
MDDELAAIAALIAAGDDRAAFARLRGRLAWPRGKDVPAAELPRWLELLATITNRLHATALGGLATAAQHDPDSPDHLYELGYALIDAELPTIAATVLWRCLALVGDSEEVVCELVSALESALAYGDALAILEDHAALRAHSFLCRYLYAFNAAMTGKLDVARRSLAGLVPESPDTEAMRATIDAMVARADRVATTCPLDARDLRGWHYVLCGGLLIHQSPFGFDDPMHGRYAWLRDSMARVATGFDRLAALARAVDVPCVYAPPGRDHEIVARAAAARLGVPIAPWPVVGVPAPGLVVLYDLAELSTADVHRMLQRRPDQILFAHATSWTRDAPIAPDVTTLLYQSLVPPWHEDERDAETIAAELAASPGLEPDDLAADQAERWTTLVAAVWPLGPGTRSRLFAGGPVPSNRFE